jgi:hypothetical protein
MHAKEGRDANTVNITPGQIGALRYWRPDGS